MKYTDHLIGASFITNENGIFIPLEPIEHFEETVYLGLAEKAIEHYQEHSNQVPYEEFSRLPLFSTPAAAIIVGTGTVGLEAIVYATRILPLKSTLIIIQNDVKDSAKLEHIFKTTIQGGSEFNWIISPSIDLGNTDKIESFLDENKNALTHTQLFIQAADKAKRYIPDRLPYKDVIAQVIRRCSTAAIEEKIMQYATLENPYVRILFSSICSVSRDKYRLANVGPYQIGKIVGDELFKSMPMKQSAYSFILYSGGMFTMGETLTKKEEFKFLQEYKDSYKRLPEEKYHQKWSNSGSHVDSMDSSGLMLKLIWEAIKSKEINLGNLYSIYGSSVPEELGFELNKLKIVEQVPYMFDPLENCPEAKE